VLLRWLILFVLLASPAVAAAGNDADALMRAGRLSEAFPVAEEEARRRPGDLDAQERLIDLAVTLGLHGMITPGYQERVRVAPGDADGHYLLGRLALGASEAEAHYRASLALDADHARSMMGLGAIHRSAGRFDQAEAAYRDALAHDPTLGEAWAGLQASLLQQGDIDRARAEAVRAMAAVPGEPDPYVSVATLDRGRAVEVLTAGVSNIPDDPRLHAMLARALLDAGIGPAARKHAGIAEKLAPTYGEASYLRLVGASMESGAIDVAGWNELAAAQEIRDAPAAQAAFDKLVARYPQASLVWLGRGKVRALRGDLEGGIGDLQQAVRLAPGEVEAQATLGVHLLRAGRAVEARPIIDAASRARPTDVSLRLARAEVAQQLGEPIKARELAVATIQAYPYDVRPVLTAARILSEQGDPRGVYLLLRDAVPRVPDPRVVVMLAAAARDVGNLAEAVDILDQIARTTGSARAAELAATLREEAQRTQPRAPGPK
jgi:tetratricopeptide (TPR) repeat protein